MIKFAPFTVDELSKKRQQTIRNSLKRCNVKRIAPSEYIDELWRVNREAVKNYKNADNAGSEEQFKQAVLHNGLEYWGAFSAETGEMAGWMSCQNNGDWTETISAKYAPSAQRAVRPSEALHYHVLNHYLNRLGQKYVCSGTRNINHKTHAQEYKITNWNFRRVHCRLHIVYNPRIKWIVVCLYPMRALLKLLDFETHFHQLNNLLKMEKIARQCRTKRNKV